MTTATRGWLLHALPAPEPEDLSWLPFLPEDIRIEEYRTADAYVVRAELPGLDPARDIAVVCRRGRLRIHAYRVPERAGASRSEFRYGSSYRTVVLPPGARPDRITATYVDGILEISIPVPRRGGD